MKILDPQPWEPRKDRKQSREKFSEPFSFARRMQAIESDMG